MLSDKLEKCIVKIIMIMYSNSRNLPLRVKKGDKMNMMELLPLKMYPFKWSLNLEAL